MQKNIDVSKKVSFGKVFWIFLVGSILGVLLEGFFCLITKGNWETHVVSVWGWFNILYGSGAACFYVGSIKLGSMPILRKVLLMAFAATLIELVCGLILKYGIGMKAWDYSNQFLNISGLICPAFTFIWALMAFGVCKATPFIESHLNFVLKKEMRFVTDAFCILLCINVMLTAISITRWSERHYEIPSKTWIDTILDNETPDDWMSSRFVEWSFIE